MDDDGQPFNWSKVTGKVLTIHSQERRPQKAYVAVQHRGWWFYIADDDQNSKATFSFLNILYSLQQASGQITRLDVARGEVTLALLIVTQGEAEGVLLAEGEGAEAKEGSDAERKARLD